MSDFLRTSLQQMQSGQIKTNEIVKRWREQNPLLRLLPEKYHRVLDDLLMRLESSQLFPAKPAHSARLICSTVCKPGSTKPSSIWRNKKF